MALTSAQKQKLTTLERAVDGALAAIPPVSADEAAAHHVLRSIKTQITNHLTDIRARGRDE